MSPLDFLHSELAHAHAQLDRLRRIAATLESRLQAQGLDETALYEQLTTHPAYRQLQRDQSFYQQLCLRLYRHLHRFAARPESTPSAPPPTPIRPTPSLNQPCPCGSTLKYKRCCGKLQLQPRRPAA